jgi:hypothetical protein
MDIDEKRQKKLARAEWVDAWRIFPRIFVALYGGLVGMIVYWFINIKTYTSEKCDAVLINGLLDRGIDLAAAQDVACTVVSVVGGPTTQHTVLVTAICSLATGVFGFYATSGRDWSKSLAPWKFGKTKQEIENTTEEE